MEIHVCLSYVGHLELTRHHLPEVLALLSLLLSPIKKKKNICVFTYGTNVNGHGCGVELKDKII